MLFFFIILIFCVFCCRWLKSSSFACRPSSLREEHYQRVTKTIQTGHEYEPKQDVTNVRLEQIQWAWRCVICIMLFADADMVTPLPCDKRHYFHSLCIEQWSKNNNDCPLCKLVFNTQLLQEALVARTTIIHACCRTWKLCRSQCSCSVGLVEWAW